MGEGRNVYLEPRERFVLRTRDVYQDELDDDVTGYSDTVLALVANYDNGGAPEGFNAQPWWASPSAARWRSGCSR